MVETLIALFLLVFGLMAGAELVRLAASSGTLAGSQGSAAIVAGAKMAWLRDLYRREPNATLFGPGNHGPEEVHIMNPETGRILNRFHISWTAAAVADSRPGKTLNALNICVTATPVDAEGKLHFRPGMNKVVSISSVFSPRIQ